MKERTPEISPDVLHRVIAAESASNGAADSLPLGVTPITASALSVMDFPPPAELIAGVLPKGVSLMASKPKVGKSIFALNVAIGIATGRSAFGREVVEEGHVIYLMFEDSFSGTKSRLGAMSGAYPEAFRAPITFFDSWPPVDAGGLDYLDRYLTYDSKTKLVVVDTLKHLRPPRDRGQGIYDYDYESVDVLKKLGDKHDCSFLINHHANKMQARFVDDPTDVISGSTGMAAAAQNLLIMRRSKAFDGVTLYVRGRDSGEPREWAMTLEPVTMTWRIRGPAHEHEMHESRKLILEAVREAREPCSPQDIADDTGLQADNVRHLVRKMHKDGQLGRQGRGQYVIAAPPHQSI